MGDENLIDISIAYGDAERVYYQVLTVSKGCSALSALVRADFFTLFPQLSVADCELGIFNQRVEHDYLLQAGDRIEVYRPLLIDPKTARRQRAERAKV